MYKSVIKFVPNFSDEAIEYLLKEKKSREVFKELSPTSSLNTQASPRDSPTSNKIFLRFHLDNFTFYRQSGYFYCNGFEETVGQNNRIKKDRATIKVTRSTVNVDRPRFLESRVIELLVIKPEEEVHSGPGVLKRPTPTPCYLAAEILNYEDGTRDPSHK